MPLSRIEVFEGGKLGVKIARTKFAVGDHVRVKGEFSIWGGYDEENRINEIGLTGTVKDIQPAEWGNTYVYAIQPDGEANPYYWEINGYYPSRVLELA